MRAAGKVMVLALVIAASMPQAASSQVAQSGGSPYTDLIAKGKRAMNDFEWTAADSVWRQLLLQPLSRQRRVDVMQLLAATLYPDDESAQNKEGATPIIQQLVDMGIRRMVVRGVSWPGLEALYKQIADATPVNVSAAGAQYDSLDAVLALINDGYMPTEITDRVNVDCYAFPFDALQSALKSSRTHGTLVDGLTHTCSRLLVETDPPDANLSVGSRDFGKVPDRGYLRWVAPEKDVALTISKGQFKTSAVVEFPQGKLLQAKFFLPRDSTLWPPVHTPEEIAENLRLFDRFVPATTRPPAPVKPHGMNAMAAGFLWGIVGGAAGYAVGQFLPFAGCTVNETVPSGETWKVKGKRYAGGESVNLGGGMPCVATVAGGSGLGLFLFSSIIKTSRNRAANGRFAEASRGYPALLKTWEERERRAFAERNPDVRQRLADERIKLAQTQADNASIRGRNASLPAPQISVHEFNFDGTAGAASARSVTPEVASDVDLRVPAGAAPNADAVAVVIGNRDYTQAGVPKADFAIRDANSVRRYLVETFGFAEDRVLLETNVSGSGMNELLGSAVDASGSRLAELVHSRPEGRVDVFVYYSGHGSPEGQPAKRFLLPIDANPKRLGATGYPLDLLYRNLTALNARSVTLAIDAGFGSFSEAGSLLQNQSYGGAIKLEVGTVGGSNAQVLLATSGEQTAKWRRDQGHSLFTYFLLKGIQGSADANGDRAVTASELEDYLKANVRSYAFDRMDGAQQTPEVFTRNPGRPVVRLRPPE